MQRDFNNRDFEQFVKQNADQYRMFPSEKVWQGIDNALHTRRRWYGLGLAFLLLLTGTAVTLVMVSTPENKQPEKVIVSNLPTSSDSEDDAAIDHSAVITKPAPANPILDAGNNLEAALFSQPRALFQVVPLIIERANDLSIAETVSILVPATPASGMDINAPIISERMSSPVYQSYNNLSTILPGMSTGDFSAQMDVINTEKKSVDEVAKTNPSVERDIYPLTIESVLNSYHPTVTKKKFTMQFYMAPNISYRKLSENKKFLQTAANNGSVPVYAAYSDINNYVSHKPDMGLEMGLTGKYAITPNLKLRAGVQFNVSRYDIKAAYDIQREDATIALDGGNWGANQTITKQTNYRNFSGNNPSNWLKNLYYSISIPLGAELTFDSESSTHFGVAATFQPTYIIKDRAYLISTDYKNYVEVPSLVRKVNMNTSFEAFVAYSTGNINWQVGPQVRYQIQSSFEKKYPFKENLFDFGLKVGIQLNR